jgi:hypothetical protein
MELTNVTIAIPLHQSLVYADIVFSNIDRLIPHCKIIVSDCTEDDRLLQSIESRFGENKNLRVIGKRTLEKGWLPHWNDLMREVDTDYFMWLSHDDEIDLIWVTENLQNLHNNPNLAGSFGLLDQILEDGSLLEFGARFPTIKNDRQFPANEILENWNLGIATRAVWEKSKVLPFLATQDPLDEWGDVVWIYGILLEYEIGQIDTVSYRKRWYAGSAHSCWRPFDLVLAIKLLNREITRRNLSPKISEELFEVALSKTLRERESLARERESLARERDSIINSNSWRFTKPLRMVKNFTKRQMG